MRASSSVFACLCACLLAQAVVCLSENVELVGGTSPCMEAWHLHAANLYQIKSTADGDKETSREDFSAAKGDYLTSHCILDDPNDVYNNEFTTGAAQMPPQELLFAKNEKLVSLYPYLWNSKDSTNSFSTDISGFGGSVVAGTLSFGPFDAEIAQDSSSPATPLPEDDGDETNDPFMLSVYLGESTDRLCFDVSLYAKMEDVGVLTKAIMTWTSSSYTSSCQLRLSSYMETELNLSGPVYYYSVKKKSQAAPGSHDTPEPALSPWLQACKLPNVDRYSYTFTPAKILPTNTLCFYVDEKAGRASPVGSRRQVNCSAVLAVQFRPSVKGVSAEEKRLAMLKIAAALTKVPTTPAVDISDGKTTAATAKEQDSGNSFSSSSSDPAVQTQDFSAHSESMTVPQQHSESFSMKKGASSTLDRAAAPAAPNVKGGLPNSVVVSNPLFGTAARVYVRCSQLSLSANFWNVSGALCQPLANIVPEQAIVNQKKRSQNWLTIVLLVISSVLASVLSFVIARLGALYLARRPRVYRR